MNGNKMVTKLINGTVNDTRFSSKSSESEQPGKIILVK